MKGARPVILKKGPDGSFPISQSVKWGMTRLAPFLAQPSDAFLNNSELGLRATD
jgi:hypothetical protein